MDLLVVDDDTSGRAMLSLSLRQAGYNVESAANGQEALQCLRHRHCDCLITDAKMQPMDGFSLTHEAKSIQPDLRVVMISAVYTARDTEGHPIDKFFPKPVPVEDLVTWLCAKRA